MLKRLCVAALLFAAPLHAQAAYSFADFTPTSNGFTVGLLFRNVNLYTDPQIIFVDKTFSITASQKIKNFCTNPVSFCDIGPNSVPTPFGAVQEVTGPVRGMIWEGNSGYGEDSCAGNFCLTRNYQAVGQGLLGCQVPFIANLVYSGRTCVADGFTGSLRLNIRFSYSGNPTSIPTFSADDIIPTFTNRVVAGPSVLTTPEPGTYALFAFGAIVIAAVKRKRR